MQITSNVNRTVVTHYQTIELADGPIIDASDTYVEGTRFRVDRVKVNHLEGKRPETIKVNGPRVDSLGKVVKIGTKPSVVHTMERVIKIADLPDEIVELLDAAGVSF